MAEILKKGHSFSQTGEKYPWDEWLNGEVWRLHRGADFTCEARVMARQAQNKARKRGFRARTHKEEGGDLVIQALPAEEARGSLACCC